MRAVGPFLRGQRIARANIAAAFPNKSRTEIEQICRGMWDNLGRVAAEYAHLNSLWDFKVGERPGRIEIAPSVLERLQRLQATGKPALLFGAHLANWELPALSLTAFGIDAAIGYRRPNMTKIEETIREIRSVKMGQLIPVDFDAARKLAQALRSGLIVGMLVDQYSKRGTNVTFFGRQTKANHLIARLARLYDCPIHGMRTIRLPNNRFQIELTEALNAPRDARGKIDVISTTQMITSVIEGWVNEHPDQWLWMHRRWR
jgi:KDO2-lipid IV(A) lauroyltransferase